MRALRVIGIVVGCVIAVLIAAVIVLQLLVHPNDYKARIQAAVRSSTGRELSLPGDIHLTIFPSLGVAFGPASLGNPPGFSSSQPFASVQHAALHVRLLPLLHRRLDVGRIEIDGLDLRLLKNTRGQGNWAMPAAKPTAPQQSGAGQVTLGGVAGVVITNSRVSYQDMVADHVNVNIGHVATGAEVPVKWNVDLTTGAGARPIALSGSASLEYDAKAAHLSSLDARVDDSTLRGSAAVTNLTTGAMSFDLSLDHIDLDRYLVPASKSTRAAPQSGPTAGAGSAQPATELPTSALKTLQLSGKVTIGSATLYRMKVSQVAVGLSADGGVLHVNPATAKLYNGTSAGTVTLDAHGDIPVLQINEKLSGVDIEPLLADFARLNRVSGRGNVTLNLTGHGKTAPQILGSLDGHAAVDLANGAINGLDLWAAINSAVALVQRHALPAGGTGSNSTRFEVFRASADLTNGVASTKDLQIASGDLHVTGQGTTNLVNGAVNYRLNAAIQQGPAAGPTLANIPLLISGRMTSPVVRPDTQALVKSVAKQQLEKHKGQVENKLRGILKGLIH